jgi:hypothetical protein
LLKKEDILDYIYKTIDLFIEKRFEKLAIPKILEGQVLKYNINGTYNIKIVDATYNNIKKLNPTGTRFNPGDMVKILVPNIQLYSEKYIIGKM